MSHADHKPHFANHRTITVYANAPETVQAETLYNAHYPRVRAFLKTRSNSPDLIEEVLQELYLKLMRIDDLSQIENPASFLIRVAHNLLIDELRRQKRAEKRQAPETAYDPDGFDQSHSPFEETLCVQRLAICEQALTELPPAFREILLLNRVEGVAHSQIAKRYGRSISWVEKAIARAVAHCRQRLELMERQ